MATEARPHVTGAADRAAAGPSVNTVATAGLLGTPGQPDWITQADPEDLLVSSSVDNSHAKDINAPTGQAYSAVQVIGVAPQPRTTWLPTDRIERETKTRPNGTTFTVERNLETGVTRTV